MDTVKTKIVFLGGSEPPKDTSVQQGVNWRGVVQAIEQACEAQKAPLVFDETSVDLGTAPDFISVWEQLGAMCKELAAARLLIVNLDRNLTMEQLIALMAARANKVPILGLTADTSHALPQNCEPYRPTMTVIRFDDTAVSWSRMLMTPIYQHIRELP